MNGTLRGTPPGESDISGGRSGPLHFGVVPLASLWLGLLFVIPAGQVIGPLGAIGQPALLVAGIAALVWAVSRLRPTSPALAGPQPMRIVLLAYLWYQAATVVRAHTRPLTALEQSGSIREMITLGFLTGVALLVADGLESVEQLTTLLRRVVLGATFMAIIGLLQFFTGAQIVPDFPVLASDGLAEVEQRSIFYRPFGTALHPIEFGAVMAALLPLSLHYVLMSPSGTSRRRNALIASVVIGLAVPLSLSRSGLVVLIVSLAVVALGWTWRQRTQAAVIGLFSIPILWLAIPGLVGTFRSLFSSVGTDPSIQARLDRIPAIMGIIREEPMFGLGAGTWSVEDYFLVDNEFWVSTMETGIVGICLTIGVILLGAVMAVTSRHHEHATKETAHLGYAIAAVLLGLSASMATFDAFFYPTLRGVLFLMLGASAALWRLTRRPSRAPDV